MSKQSGYRVAPAPLEDIDEIADRIRLDNPSAAKRFIDEVYDAFELRGQQQTLIWVNCFCSGSFGAVTRHRAIAVSLALI